MKIDSTVLDQRDNLGLNIWTLLKVLVGAILLIKAGDGLFPIFPKSTYGPEAQDLFQSLKAMPSVNIAITTFHFIVGGFILWNAFVPIFLAAALPVFTLATVFEFLYGTALFPQMLAIVGLISCLALLYHYRGQYSTMFVKDN